jgi:hypothetical protein
MAWTLISPSYFSPPSLLAASLASGFHLESSASFFFMVKGQCSIALNELHSVVVIHFVIYFHNHLNGSGSAYLVAVKIP